MKVCIIQPKYSTDYSLSDEYFNREIKLLEQCDETMDLIVCPESCDVPCLAKTKEEYENSVAKYKDKLLSVASTTAKRCHAALFINAASEHEKGLRNTTYAIDPEGEIVGYYYKQHLTPGEVSERKLDSDYTYEYSEPTIVEIAGIRYAFLTCYDFYFYEAYPTIALKNVDIIIGCSHQRSDTHRALEIMTAFCAYNCNAYVVRSSVSMDENSDIGGASMVVAPNGTVLANMYSRVGMETVEINPKEKYFKPAGFGNPPSAHYEYIEKGRRPWKYRPAGSTIVKPDSIMPYPRVCAHRGFNTIAPENSLAAFGAAVALGADEIEFDIWTTKDGELVSMHDCNLERLSDGTGNVWGHTLEELREYDFGVKTGPEFKGLRIIRFEDILKKFAGTTIMNIHVKMWGMNGLAPMFDEIARLIREYDCTKHVYMMSSDTEALREFKRKNPDICCCRGAGDGNYKMVEEAISWGFEKVQFMKEKEFDEALVAKAHAHGIRCNIFWSDDPKEAIKFLDMGIDTILTNDYLQVANVVKAYCK